MYIHIIASRKLRLQICSAVYCLSWLFFFFFFFFFLLLLFLIFNIRFPFSDLASFVFSFLHSLCILSFHSFTRLFTLSVCIFYASSLYNFFSLFFLLLSFFFFRLSKIFFFFFVQRLSSREENNSSTRSSSVSRFRRRILFPLVRRGWQFRRMSHCGAASRTNRSLVLAILRENGSFFFNCFFFSLFIARSFFFNNSRVYILYSFK